MSNFLVLGIGNAQIDLLRYLKENTSTKIYAVGNEKDAPGYPFVDDFSEIDIHEKEKVLQYAKKNNVQHIYSIGSDISVPTISWVAEKLKIPYFVDYETAKICTNKFLLREKLKNTYGSIPYSLWDKNTKNCTLKFPVITKPVDSQGQRGVNTASSHEDLKEACQQALEYSKSSQVIIEEKIEGYEVSVNVYLHNNSLVFFLPSLRKSWEQFNSGIIHKHILPLKTNKETIKNIKKLVQETTEVLAISNGPVYFQIKIRDNQAYLIEVTPRLDGCHLWRLIKLATGINLLDTTITHLMSNNISIFPKFKVKALTLEFECLPPHSIVSHKQKNITSIYKEWYYQDGETVKCMNGKMEKCGYKIIEGI